MVLAKLFASAPLARIKAVFDAMENTCFLEDCLNAGLVYISYLDGQQNVSDWGYRDNILTKLNAQFNYQDIQNGDAETFSAAARMKSSTAASPCLRPWATSSRS